MGGWQYILETKSVNEDNLVQIFKDAVSYYFNNGWVVFEGPLIDPPKGKFCISNNPKTRKMYFKDLLDKHINWIDTSIALPFNGKILTKSQGDLMRPAFRQTKDWTNIKNAVFARNHGMCEVPGCDKQAIDCHHLNTATDYVDYNTAHYEGLCRVHHLIGRHRPDLSIKLFGTVDFQSNDPIANFLVSQI